MLDARIKQVLSFKMMSFTVNLSIVIYGGSGVVLHVNDLF